MFDWENKRKEKLEKKMKEQNGKEENEFDYKPKIDGRSSSMAKKNKRRTEEPDVFSRLAKEDKMLKEKRQVLIDLYRPTFQPNTFLHNQKIKGKNNETEVRKKENPKSESSSDSDDDDDDDDDDEDDEEGNEESSSDSDDEEDNFDYKQDPKIFAEDNVQDAFRKALFNKMKK